MHDLELAEKKVELLRVQAAKAEMILNVMKKEQEILRVKEQIKIQESREAELEKTIGGMNG